MPTEIEDNLLSYEKMRLIVRQAPQWLSDRPWFKSMKQKVEVHFKSANKGGILTQLGLKLAEKVGAKPKG